MLRPPTCPAAVGAFGSDPLGHVINDAWFRMAWGGSDSYWLPGARREEPTGGAAIAVVERIIGVESAVIAEGAGPTYLGMNLETDRPRRQRMSRAATADAMECVTLCHLRS
jgi:hypothetical protein